MKLLALLGVVGVLAVSGCTATGSVMASGTGVGAAAVITVSRTGPYVIDVARTLRAAAERHLFDAPAPSPLPAKAYTATISEVTPRQWQSKDKYNADGTPKAGIAYAVTTAS